MRISVNKMQTLKFTRSEFPVFIVSLIRLFLIGSCISLAFQMILVWSELPDFFMHNRIDKFVRLRIAVVTLGGGVLCVIFTMLLLLRSAPNDKLRQLRSLASLCYPLVSVPLLVILLNPLIFKDHQLLVLIMILLLAIIFEHTLRISIAEGTNSRPQWAKQLKENLTGLPTYMPTLLLAVLVIGFIVYFSHYTLLNHYRFQTFSYDLGLYDNMMWNTLRGEWFKSTPLGLGNESHFTYHAEFGAYFLAPFYALRQQADTLLIIQTGLAGATLIPIYLIARLRLKSSWLALAICYVFAIYAPLHGPLFYDFHFLTISIFFIAWVIYFFDKGNLPAVIAATIVAMLWREDISPGLSAIGVYYLLTGNRPRWAVGLIILPILYFITMKFFVMPQYALHRDLAQSQIWAYADLMPAGDNSLVSVFVTMITNPAYVLKHVLDQDKLIYVLQLFIPVLFLPLRTPTAWVLLLPAAAFTLLATGYVPVYQISFQYTAYWIVYLFFALIICLQNWQKTPAKKLQLSVAIPTMLLISTVSSLHYGAIFQHKTFSTGMSDIIFNYSDIDRANYAEFISLAKLIPKEASVAATETEVPHLSNRRDCYTLRLGYNNADYILARLTTIEQDIASRSTLANALDSGKYNLLSNNRLFSLWAKVKGTQASVNKETFVNQ